MNQRLIEIIESFRMEKHFCFDDDCWFSCPMSESECYCGPSSGEYCNCGFEETNARVDEALLLVRNENESV